MNYCTNVSVITVHLSPGSASDFGSSDEEEPRDRVSIRRLSWMVAAVVLRVNTPPELWRRGGDACGHVPAEIALSEITLFLRSGFELRPTEHNGVHGSAHHCPLHFVPDSSHPYLLSEKATEETRIQFATILDGIADHGIVCLFIINKVHRDNATGVVIEAGARNEGYG